MFHLIVKHPSEWYYGKDEPFWKGYLDSLTTDAPLWKAYTESFIDKMAWMQQVEGMGPEPWHMHPVVFLGCIQSRDAYEITVALIEALLGHKKPWFTSKSGGKVFAEKFQKEYPNIFEFDKQQFVTMLNSVMNKYGITGPYHKAHFCLSVYMNPLTWIQP